VSAGLLFETVSPGTCQLLLLDETDPVPLRGVVDILPARHDVTGVWFARVSRCAFLRRATAGSLPDRA
jgi:hypothetical protein